MDECMPFYCKGFPDDVDWNDLDYYCYYQCDRCLEFVLEYHRKRKEDE